MAELNNKHAITLKQIFEKPTRSDIRWTAIIALLAALGAIISQRAGSRVGVKLKSERIVVHAPHPEKVICKGLVNDLRVFLRNAGFTPKKVNKGKSKE